MSEIYFTITGNNHWQGKELIESGMKVRLEKASGEVLFVLPGGVLCKLELN